MGGAFALVELAAQCVAGSTTAARLCGSVNPNRVRNLSGGYFVVTHQAGKNRQARGIGRSPRPGTLFVAQQVPNRRRIGVPGPVAVGNGGEQFVEKAVAVIEHQHVAIAATRIRTALDLSVGRKRHRPRIAFVAVGGEVDVNRRLRSAHHRVGDSDNRTLV